MRSYTIPARTCGESSVGVVAGPQKLFYIPKAAKGGIAGFVCQQLGIKAREHTSIVKVFLRSSRPPPVLSPIIAFAGLPGWRGQRELDEVWVGFRMGDRPDYFCEEGCGASCSKPGRSTEAVVRDLPTCASSVERNAWCDCWGMKLEGLTGLQFCGCKMDIRSQFLWTS